MFRVFFTYSVLKKDAEFIARLKLGNSWDTFIVAQSRYQKKIFFFNIFNGFLEVLELFKNKYNIYATQKHVKTALPNPKNSKISLITPLNPNSSGHNAKDFVLAFYYL